MKCKKEKSHLLRYAKNVTSQSGEDGIIDYLFYEALVEYNRDRSLCCVEIGAWDGKHLSNTYNLCNNKNWSGVLIEANEERYNELQTLYSTKPHIICRKDLVAFEGPTSLTDQLLQLPIVKSDFQFLSIDIDGADYHIWDSFSTIHYYPQVVCIEFNPTIPNDIIFIQEKDMRIYQGSSLLAITQLGERKGYTLIVTTVYNAFFLRNDLMHYLPVFPRDIYSLHPGDMCTSLFQTYDGELKFCGPLKLLWHRLSINPQQFQILSKKQRIFPFAPPGDDLVVDLQHAIQVVFKDIINLKTNINGTTTFNITDETATTTTITTTTTTTILNKPQTVSTLSSSSSSSSSSTTITTTTLLSSLHTSIQILLSLCQDRLHISYMEGIVLEALDTLLYILQYTDTDTSNSLSISIPLSIPISTTTTTTSSNSNSNSSSSGVRSSDGSNSSSSSSRSGRSIIPKVVQYEYIHQIATIFITRAVKIENTDKNCSYEFYHKAYCILIPLLPLPSLSSSSSSSQLMTSATRYDSSYNSSTTEYINPTLKTLNSSPTDEAQLRKSYTSILYTVLDLCIKLSTLSIRMDKLNESQSYIHMYYMYTFIYNKYLDSNYTSISPNTLNECILNDESKITNHSSDTESINATNITQKNSNDTKIISNYDYNNNNNNNNNRQDHFNEKKIYKVQERLHRVWKQLVTRILK